MPAGKVCEMSKTLSHEGVRKLHKKRRTAESEKGASAPWRSVGCVRRTLATEPPGFWLSDSEDRFRHIPLEGDVAKRQGVRYSHKKRGR